MVSARMRVMLFPAGSQTNAVEAIGDIPSWIVSIKGSEEFCIEVPYLQKHPWSHTDLQDYVVPVVKVMLLDPISQPFDKTVSVFCVLFRSAGDIQFCGLQSCVPSTLQSVASSMSRAKTIQQRAMSSFYYQGGIDDVYSILGRFSSRTAEPSDHYPFPLKIDDWNDLYSLDNFDYYCNLFKFYTGDTKIKILFSSAPANQVIEATIRNTEANVGGSDFKAGNGIAATHQSVWPTIDLVFPYMCINEFNSIWEPEPMYTQFVSSEATISKYLIAMTDLFRVFYLLPVPDFFLTEEPDEEPSIMQSFNRINSTRSFIQRFSVTAGTASNNVLLIADPTINAKAMYGSFRISCNTPLLRTDSFYVTISGVPQSGLAPAAFTTGVACASTVLSTATDASQVSNFTAGWSSFGFDNLYCNVQTIGANAVNTVQFVISGQLAPFSSFVGLTNPFNFNSTGFVEFPTSQSVTVATPVDVNITGSTITQNVAVTNTPAVTITGTPTVIVDHVSDPVDVNILGQPIDVNVSSSPMLPIYVQGRVQGVSSPDTPVFTSSYFNVN
jgi:hypothetical protein